MTAITSSRSLGWAFACCAGILSVTAPVFAAPQRLSRETLLDKIRGGWASQMIGVAYGAKTEFKSNAKIGDWELPWNPGMLENTIHQDDPYVEMTFEKVMEILTRCGQDSDCNPSSAAGVRGHHGLSRPGRRAGGGLSRWKEGGHRRFLHRRTHE